MPSAFDESVICFISKKAVIFIKYGISFFIFDKSKILVIDKYSNLEESTIFVLNCNVVFSSVEVNSAVCRVSITTQ